MTGNPRIQWLNLSKVQDIAGRGNNLEVLVELAAGLMPVIEEREYGAASHSLETAETARMIGQRLGLPDRTTEILYLAGLVHDIGKTAVPESILNKTCPLNAVEQKALERHAVVGAAIVSPVSRYVEADELSDIVLHHHERRDGSGYPHRYSGEDIPFGARIIAVADTISSNLRPGLGQKGMGFCESVARVHAESGTLFDPDVTSAMWDIRREICRRLWELRSTRKKA